VGAVGWDTLPGPWPRPAFPAAPIMEAVPSCSLLYFYFVSLCSVRRLHLGQNFLSVSLSLCPGFLNFVVW